MARLTSTHPQQPASLKILFAAAECTPFFKVGGLADVVGSLPLALQALGHDVRVIVPRYRPIDAKKFGLKRVDRFIDVPAGEAARTTEILESHFTGVPTYFVWDERFFGRDQVYGQPDELMAFVFFSRAVIEFLRTSEWTPDVLHAHDWHTGAALMHLATRGRRLPGLKNIASVLTIHNLFFQGVGGNALLRFAGFKQNPPRLIGEAPGAVNWLARGIAYADAVNTVSPTYAKQILTREFGEGLADLLKARSEPIAGILNGLGQTEWNSQTDPLLAANFTASTLKRRAANKRAVQDALNLKRKPRTPLLGMVTRLFDQKGLDILLEAAPQFLQRDVQLAVLGSGDEKYHAALRDLVARYPGRAGVDFTFNEPLARNIYGGSDLFLMPSHFEPCGLSQLIAMRYGAAPVVRATGGLADTVLDADRSARRGTGFTFKAYSAAALLGALDRAVAALADADRWQAIQRRGMAADFSWNVSARQYQELYRRALEVHRKIKSQG
jgi:starch synthase